MSQEERYLTRSDPTLIRIGEAALRLMAGQVSRTTMNACQELVRGQPQNYPWEQVTDRLLADPVAPADLVQPGLRAQRDWVVRGGRETPGHGLRLRAKTGLAKLLVRALFFMLYLLVVLSLLLLLKQKWPAVDIYSGLRWLQHTLPGLFPPN